MDWSVAWIGSTDPPRPSYTSLHARSTTCSSHSRCSGICTAHDTYFSWPRAHAASSASHTSVGPEDTTFSADPRAAVYSTCPGPCLWGQAGACGSTQTQSKHWGQAMYLATGPYVSHPWFFFIVAYKYFQCFTPSQFDCSFGCCCTLRRGFHQAVHNDTQVHFLNPTICKSSYSFQCVLLCTFSATNAMCQPAVNLPSFTKSLWRVVFKQSYQGFKNKCNGAEYTLSLDIL